MSDYITKADLLEASDKILKEDQRLRHKLGNKVQDDYLKIDEKVGNNDKELALLKQSHNTMSENIKDIKKDMKEGFQNLENKMESFIHTMQEGYATKAEHKENKEEIVKIKEASKKGLIYIISLLVSIIGSIGYLIISKFI